MSFVNFHQKAICDLPEEFYQSKPELSHFYQGSSTLASEELMVNAEDCIRFMIEDCDFLGQFEIMVDAASPLGGFACAIGEQLLIDEYPKTFIKTWASFENCLDFEFASEASTPSPLIAASLAGLSKISSQVIPLFMGTRKTEHKLVDERLFLSRALDASIVTSAAVDVLSTATLTGQQRYSERKLLDLRLCTPLHGAVDKSPFTSLATGRQGIVESWERMNPIQRINHTEETYPGKANAAIDLPIYCPNFMYTGYQQQASSGIVLPDMQSAELSTHVQSMLIKDLSRKDFVGLPTDEDAFYLFTDVQETLYSMIEMDD